MFIGEEANSLSRVGQGQNQKISLKIGSKQVQETKAKTDWKPSENMLHNKLVKTKEKKRTKIHKEGQVKWTQVKLTRAAHNPTRKEQREEEKDE